MHSVSNPSLPRIRPVCDMSVQEDVKCSRHRSAKRRVHLTRRGSMLKTGRIIDHPPLLETAAAGAALHVILMRAHGVVELSAKAPA